MVLARHDERQTCPYHCSLRLFIMVRRSSFGPIACWILARTSSLLTWSLYKMRSILRKHFISLACILLWRFAVRVHDLQAFRKMDVTRERISRILELREILLSFQTSFNLVNAAVVYAIPESISGLEPSSVINEPRYLKLVTVSSSCPFTCHRLRRLCWDAQRILPILLPFLLSHQCHQQRGDWWLFYNADGDWWLFYNADGAFAIF